MSRLYEHLNFYWNNLKSPINVSDKILYLTFLIDHPTTDNNYIENTKAITPYAL